MSAVPLTVQPVDAGAFTPWRRLLPRVLGYYLATRLVLWLLAVFIIVVLGGEDRSSLTLSRALCQWDCGWYMNIAKNGYLLTGSTAVGEQSSLAFYPVFPLLVRGAVSITGMTDWIAAVVLSNVALVLALLLMHRYAQERGLAEEDANFAVLAMCLVPQGFVFSAAYTESLFLMLTLLSALAFQRRHHFGSGVVAAAVTATRASGVLMLPYFIVGAWRARGWRDMLRPWRAPDVFIPIVLLPLGVLAFWTWCFINTGDAFAPTSAVHHGWGWTAVPFWENWRAFWRAGDNAAFWLSCSVLAFLAMLPLLRARLYEEFAFGAAALLVLWSGAVPNSLLRYSIGLFPLYLGLALFTRRRASGRTLLLAAFTGLNALLLYAWLHQLQVSI